MKRDEQIELMQSAEARTTGYLRAWMKDASVKAALRRTPRPAVSNDDHSENRSRRFG
ncbi:hypothetical protein MCBMB27_02661 [Methylobacterium phyllosphaerae]|uniref:Uncharacterized protein n=1 Tax=Methylobacterium phyllosphaerae TaxID=418223 RepID=A0AAE8HSH0_9HYPH|nr:hypothetical protein [Methylobacterium phyllosphaerae]APT31952.1 hypothetical protein MCBMB27_02661 [Methylobacterium phyllosphaerae]SFH01005.1 hypothetical protein SAMN05192567_1126 [Methylobacterium phyllosphaerae]